MAKLASVVMCFIIAAAIAPSLLLAQDVIIFRNGDRMSGEIREIQFGKLTLHSGRLDSDAVIDWKQIERVVSDRVFQFQTRSGEKFLGQISSTESSKDTLRVISGGVTREIHHDEIFLVTETVRGFSGLLKVNAGAGVSLTKSNNQLQWNAQLGAEFSTPRHSLGATFDSVFTSQDDIDDTSRNSLRLAFNRQLPKQWGLMAMANFLSSSEQNLDLRTTLGGGPSYDFVRNNTLLLRVSGGVVWVNDHYNEEVIENPERSDIAGMGGITFSIYRFKQWNLDSVLYVFPSMTDYPRVQLDWRVNLRFRIIRGHRLWWNFTNSVDYDSKPPSDTSGSDYVLTTSVSYDFP